MAQSVDPSNVRKIAFLRANALGDFIFIIPALKALRETFPQAEIVLLGKGWHKGFAHGHVPTIDRVITVPDYPGVGAPEGAEKDEAAIERFMNEMQAEGFDLAFQAHGGGGNSNPFVARLGAKLTIGLQAPGAPALDINMPYSFYQNEYMRYLELVRNVGAKTADILPRVTVLNEDRQEAGRFLNGKVPEKGYIVLHPGASDPRRRWPAEKFAAVATKFIDKGYAVVVTGAGDEQPVVQAVVATEPRAINAYQAVSLGGLAGLLEGAELVVSNDTGPMHLAYAVGTPTIGLYWVGNQIMAGELTRLNHRPLLSWTIDCPVCGTLCVNAYNSNSRGCEHQESFMADISIERVLEEAYDLLATD